MGYALAIVALGVAAWPALGEASDSAFRVLANGILGGTTFGAGGHVAFEPVAPREVSSTAHDDDASWSTRLELRIDGIPARESVRMNARRLLYLPTVLLLAIVLASPLRGRRKALALALGAAVLFAAALLSSWLTAVWLFAAAPGLVYDLTGAERAALRFAYEAWVSALGNRYVLPIFTAATLIVLLRSSHRPASARRRARSARAAS